MDAVHIANGLGPSRRLSEVALKIGEPATLLDCVAIDNLL
jgi:hypothetical protein